MAHIVCDRFVQPLLGTVPVLPCHGLETGESGFKQRLTIRINSIALFSADDERPHAVTADAAFIRKRVLVNQLHQAHELIRLALVRRGRQQQQVGRRFGKRCAQLVACHLVGAATHAMRLVNDHQIPRCRNQVLKPFAVVIVQLVQAPALAALDRFDRVQ